MSICGTVQVVLNDNRVLQYKGFVRDDFDASLRKAQYGISEVEGNSLRNFIFEDRKLEPDEQLSAFLLTACTELGGRVKSITYQSGVSDNPVSFQCKMHATTRETIRKELKKDVKKTERNDSLKVITNMLRGRLPQQKTLDSVFGQRSDAALTVRIRDHLVEVEENGDNGKWGPSVPMGGPVAHDKVSWVINEVRDAPHLGKETIDLLMNLVRDARFEKTEDWYSLRSTLQERYAEDLKKFFPPERIVAELFRMADSFANQRNAICVEEGAKLLALGAMEGIPSLEVRRALHIIRERFAFTEPAKKAFSAYLDSLPCAEPKKWTFFVYLAGDNNLESCGLGDINEMEAAFGHVAKFMNVVVLVDGAKYQDVGDSPAYNWKSKSRMLCIQQNDHEDGRAVVSKEIPIPNNCALGDLMRKGNGELNMASGKTLQAAVEFVQKAFPSDQMFVDVWNHGDSWRGVASDDSSPYSDDMIRMKEMATALKNLQKKIAVVGFDACLEGNVSVAEALYSANVDYMVGSQEVEPGEGWNYTKLFKRLGWLFRRDGKLTAEAAAKATVKVYDGETLAAVRLDGLPTVRQQLDVLAQQLLQEGGFANPKILNVAESCRSTEYDAGAVDAINFAKKLAENYPPESSIHAAATRLAELLEGMTIANQTTPEYADKSKGFSLYIPVLADAEDSFVRGTTGWLDSCPNWKRFVHGESTPIV